MLTKAPLKKIVDFPDSSVCFPGVEIKGGVCYFLAEEGWNGLCTFESRKSKEPHILDRDLKQFDVLFRYNEAETILRKVQSKDEPSFLTQVSAQKPFGLRTNFPETHPQDFLSQSTETHNVFVYAKKQQGWTDPQLITKHKEWVPLYKVLTPRSADGSGKFPIQVIGPSFIAGPNTASTETYLVIGPYQTSQEAHWALAYLKTKFFRFMLSLRKTTQDLAQGKFQYVPLPEGKLQKLWTDQELYAHYGLTKEEQDYINQTIRALS